MADIELVVKIPEEIRLALINNIQLSMDQQSICDSCIKQVIINGTPLLKGHGDLVDYEELKNNAREYGAYAEATLSHIKPKIIIEADKEQEDGNDNN